ncbi:MAG: RHS repeat-associated core domain-containing protein, partial [Anaerolinea sp.]|nr:RHS repeat-associated core domain-containing protein [Anaerolinea sp.]
SSYYCYDANGNMTKRVEGGVTTTQNFNVENELSSVVSGGNTTSFTYDAAGMRVKSVEPGGKTTYYAFPGYEEEVVGSTTTRRITYSVAGQAVALRVHVVGNNSALYYLHSDHLGSTSLATNTSGGVISGSTARYTPFGDWRTEPTAGLTDRGFTGHMHNNLGSAPEDIGLVYMAARWYSPTLGRFISADTLVPDPANPQGWNRYTYTINNPLSLVDPSGHCWGPLSFARNTFYATTCNNLDMALTIVTSPDASVLEKVAAGGYMFVEGTAHAAVAMGTAVATGQVVAPYAGAAIAAAQTTAVAHPTAAAVMGGVMETAGECALTGGGCTVVDYLVGGATAGVAHRLSEGRIYRGASGTPDSITPRPGIDDVPGSQGQLGLSFFDSLDNPNVKPGKYVSIDVARLSNLEAHFDNIPLGHVSVRPPTLHELQGWSATRGTGQIHPFTQELFDANFQKGIKPN